MNAEDLFDVIAIAPMVGNPAVGLSAAIDHRRLDEVHPCAFCGQRAGFAWVAGPSDLSGPARWVDACGRCHGELRKLVTGPLWWPENGRASCRERVLTDV